MDLHPPASSTAPTALPTRVRFEGGSAMGFDERLKDHPVVVEVIPPRSGAPQSQVDQALKTVGELIEGTRCDAVNVPEILGSGFQGMDPLDFGVLVQKEYGAPVVVNKVVVHEPEVAFRAWFDRALASELSSVVLVGGERGGIYYPGPSVIEANRIAKELTEASGHGPFPVGNVTLPARRREAARMVEKARAGADYFITQIIYEFASANVHLQAYDDVCAFAGEERRPVLYAFSPAQTKRDVLFLRYLGVNITPEIEQEILSTENGGPNASERIIRSLWSQLLEAAAARGVQVPLGLVVETVSKHNVAAASSLTRALRASLDAARVASREPVA